MSEFPHFPQGPGNPGEIPGAFVPGEALSPHIRLIQGPDGVYAPVGGEQPGVPGMQGPSDPEQTPDPARFVVDPTGTAEAPEVPGVSTPDTSAEPAPGSDVVRSERSSTPATTDPAQHRHSQGTPHYTTTARPRPPQAQAQVNNPNTGGPTPPATPPRPPRGPNSPPPFNPNWGPNTPPSPNLPPVHTPKIEMLTARMRPYNPDSKPGMDAARAREAHEASRARAQVITDTETARSYADLQARLATRASIGKLGVRGRLSTQYRRNNIAIREAKIAHNANLIRLNAGWTGEEKLLTGDGLANLHRANRRMERFAMWRLQRTNEAMKTHRNAATKLEVDYKDVLPVLSQIQVTRRERRKHYGKVTKELGKSQTKLAKLGRRFDRIGNSQDLPSRYIRRQHRILSR